MFLSVKTDVQCPCVTFPFSIFNEPSLQQKEPSPQENFLSRFSFIKIFKGRSVTGNSSFNCTLFLYLTIHLMDPYAHTASCFKAIYPIVRCLLTSTSFQTSLNMSNETSKAKRPALVKKTLSILRNQHTIAGYMTFYLCRH